jgi:hypothetical protein
MKKVDALKWLVENVTEWPVFGQPEMPVPKGCMWFFSENKNSKFILICGTDGRVTESQWAKETGNPLNKTLKYANGLEAKGLEVSRFVHAKVDKAEMTEFAAKSRAKAEKERAK